MANGAKIVRADYPPRQLHRRPTTAAAGAEPTPSPPRTAAAPEVDTPERSECNYDTATAELAGALAAHGNRVILAPGATDDSDRYGRLLRYVDTPSGADIGHPVTITGPDYHSLDRDGDGVACESQR